MDHPRHNLHQNQQSGHDCRACSERWRHTTSTWRHYWRHQRAETAHNRRGSERYHWTLDLAIIHGLYILYNVERGKPCSHLFQHEHQSSTMKPCVYSLPLLFYFASYTVIAYCIISITPPVGYYSYYQYPPIIFVHVWNCIKHRLSALSLITHQFPKFNLLVG